MLNNQKSLKSTNVHVLEVSENRLNLIEVAKKDKLYTRSFVTKIYNNTNIEDQLHELFEENYQLTNNDATNMIVNFSGNNVYGFTVVLDYKRLDVENLIDENEMQNVYKSIKDKALTIANFKHEINTLENPIEFELADLVITTIKLDDTYEIDPIGKISKSIKVAAFCSFIPKNTYLAVRDALKDENIKLDALTTNYYTLYRVSAKKFSNFIQLSVNHTYTEIAIVFGKNIIDTRYLGLGRDFIVEYIANNLQTDVKTSEGKLLGFIEDTILEDEYEIIKDLISNALEIYINAVDAAIDGIGTVEKLPNNIVFANLGSDIKNLIDIIDMKSELNLVKDRDIDQLNFEDIDNLVDDLKVLHTSNLQSLASTIIITTE